MVLAVIGGSGLKTFDGFELLGERAVETPYAEHPVPLLEFVTASGPMFFLARHGTQTQLPPHAVNYRANIRALADVGVTDVVTINIVGGISPAMSPGAWVIPDQLIDYTWGRDHTYYDGGTGAVEHVDFEAPFDAPLAARLRQAALRAGVSVDGCATYGCTQGPRLETAAEIGRLARDGCDIVGMTAMPEAALARESGIRYAALCLVVNWAAGRGEQATDIEAMFAVVEREMPRVVSIVRSLVNSLET